MNERSRLDERKTANHLLYHGIVATRAEAEECARIAGLYVFPDPRIARIEALCDQVDQANADVAKTHWRILGTGEVRAILRGDA